MRVRGREAAGWIDYDWTSEVSAAIDPLPPFVRQRSGPS
jgi:hypothetical protein